MCAKKYFVCIVVQGGWPFSYLTGHYIFTGHNQLSPTRCINHQLCLGCPSHSAKFKKRLDCVKVVMFGAL